MMSPSASQLSNPASLSASVEITAYVGGQSILRQSSLRQSSLRQSSLRSIIRTVSFALVLFSLPALAFGQSATEPDAGSAAAPEMSSEELAAFIKEQQLQLDAVKQARDAQKAKQAQVQEALIDRQEKLNQIVIEMSELCAERKELDPDDTEPCVPEES